MGLEADIIHNDIWFHGHFDPLLWDWGGDGGRGGRSECNGNGRKRVNGRIMAVLWLVYYQGCGHRAGVPSTLAGAHNY